ncbi:MAG: hypothetical protein AB1742_01725 [bacterium]
MKKKDWRADYFLSIKYDLKNVGYYPTKVTVICDEKSIPSQQEIYNYLCEGMVYELSYMKKKGSYKERKLKKELVSASLWIHEYLKSNRNLLESSSDKNENKCFILLSGVNLFVRFNIYNCNVLYEGQNIKEFKCNRLVPDPKINDKIDRMSKEELLKYLELDE